MLIGWVGIATVLPSLADSPPAAGPSAGLSERETRVFQQICAQCHAQPGLGVPVIGDEAEWQLRRAKGIDRLLANTIEGWLDMPPLGTCSFCSEQELRRLVAFLAGLPLDGAR